MPKESTVPLICKDRRFRFVVMVTAKADPIACYHCKGQGEGITETLDWIDCPVCKGHKVSTTLNVFDDELEEHLRKCMDDFLNKKYRRTNED